MDAGIRGKCSIYSPLFTNLYVKFPFPANIAEIFAHEFALECMCSHFLYASYIPGLPIAKYLTNRNNHIYVISSMLVPSQVA